MPTSAKSQLEGFAAHSEEVMACEKTLLANKICAMALQFEADKVKLED